MALRFGSDLDEETSDAEVDEIVAALKAQPDIPVPAPTFKGPAPRRATRRKSPRSEPAPDVSRETSAAEGEESSEFTADPDPDYGRDDHLADKLFPDAPVTPKRVAQAVQKDIRAKVAMLLSVVAAGWQSYDPHCGGMALQCVPDRGYFNPETGEIEERPGIATALTDILIDSPDIVNWFTTSGRYMKWLTLATTVQPLLTMLWAHHVSHSVGDTDEETPDWSTYVTH